MTEWILLAVVVIVLVWGVAIYNGLVAARNRFKNAFAQIDVQLQRRYDLIPNLVESTKAYLRHERETLEAVIQARNQAQGAARGAAAAPDSAGAIQALAGAEVALGGALGRLFALMEAYPDLKADDTVRRLTEELASTENRVGFARQAFNDSVMDYNIRRELFPNNFVAGPFGFQAAEQLRLETPEAREAPRISFA